MTNSLNPHHRKGREGKGIGKWKGNRVETSHHGVAFVTREAVDGMMR